MRASELEESAADELKRELPSLKKTDYDTIDNLMKRISRRYKITGKKLHDMFVAKYHHTPDHWIKKYKEKLGEGDIVSFKNRDLGGKIVVVYLDGEPKFKFKSKSEAMRIVNDLRKEFPNSKVEIKYINDPKTMYEEVETSDDEQKIKDFITWSLKALNMQKPYPKIQLSADTEKAKAGHHTGVHDGENIWVYVGDRNLIDIFRTIFHELVHHRQHQLNMIKDGDSYPGSPIEAMEIGRAHV